jgi:hypothetical protein
VLGKHTPSISSLTVIEPGQGQKAGKAKASLKKKRLGAGGSQPLIPATQETKIRWIAVQSQPRQIVREALS